MARRKSRKQAKPTELLIGYGIAAVGLVSAGAFYIPPEAITPFITLLLCGAALGGMWFYYFVYLKEQARRQALLARSVGCILIDREKLGLLASKKISIDQFVFREG